jgi:hypothetical protein
MWEDSPMVISFFSPTLINQTEKFLENFMDFKVSQARHPTQFFQTILNSTHFSFIVLSRKADR